MLNIVELWPSWTTSLNNVESIYDFTKKAQTNISTKDILYLLFNFRYDEIKEAAYEWSIVSAHTHTDGTLTYTHVDSLIYSSFFRHVSRFSKEQFKKIIYMKDDPEMYISCLFNPTQLDVDDIYGFDCANIYKCIVKSNPKLKIAMPLKAISYDSLKIFVQVSSVNEREKYTSYKDLCVDHGSTKILLYLLAYDNDLTDKLINFICSNKLLSSNSRLIKSDDKDRCLACCLERGFTEHMKYFQ